MLSLLLLVEVEVAELFLLDELEVDLTVLLCLLFLEELELDLVAAELRFPEELCDLSTALLVLLVVLCGLAVLLDVLDELLRVLLTVPLEFLPEVVPCDLTVLFLSVDVAGRCDLTVLLLLRSFVVCRVALLLRLLDELLLVALVDLTDEFRSVVEVLVRGAVEFVDLVEDDLLLASGRYTLTELLLTRVALPERLLLLSRRRTLAFRPVSRS